jgi:hypothetical protein
MAADTRSAHAKAACAFTFAKAVAWCDPFLQFDELKAAFPLWLTG